MCIRDRFWISGTPANGNLLTNTSFYFMNAREPKFWGFTREEYRISRDKSKDGTVVTGTWGFKIFLILSVFEQNICIKVVRH